MTRLMVLLSAVLVVIVTCNIASAAEIRIVDGVGLVRAVRLVKGPSTVVVVGVDVGAQCSALSVDGIEGERNVSASGSGECTFSALPPGTWQIKVSSGHRWKARIDG